MKTIFLVLPRRISFRYMLSSDVYALLCDRKDIRLVIITAVKEKDIIKDFQSKNAVFEFVDLREDTEHIFEKLFRKLRHFLWVVISSPRATYMGKTKSISKLYFFAYLIGRFIAPIFIPLKWVVDFIWLGFFSRLFDKPLEYLFNNYRPDLIFIHAFFELTTIPFIRIAHRRKIKTLGMTLSWDQLTSKGSFYGPIDKLLVWNEILKEEAIRYHGFRPDSIYVVGTPQFDFYIKYKDKIISRDNFFKKFKLDLNKKLIVYTTTPEHISPTEPEIIKFLSEAIDCGVIAYPSQIFVRIYTKDRLSRYNTYRNLKHVTWDYQGDVPPGLGAKETDIYMLSHLAATIKAADVVLNVASTISIDAAIFDKPVVNIAVEPCSRKFHYYAHYANIVATGGVRVAHTNDQLINFINQYLKDSSLDSVGRFRIVKEQCYMVDGKSARRVANAILDAVQ